MFPTTAFTLAHAAPAASTASAARPTVPHNWQAVHGHLTAQAGGYLTMTSLADFALYYACAYHAGGNPADGNLARSLAQQLAAQRWPAPGHRWTTPHLHQATVLAWLAAHDAAPAKPHQLATLDEVLYQEARHLRAQSACARPLLGQIARYLRLRLPAPRAAGYLHNVLAHWPAAPVATPAAPLLVGLDGQVAELLGLIRAHRAGIQPPFLQARVQQGLRSILATKRDVDFSAYAYAVFPYQVSGSRQPAGFSAELSWRRGDAGVAWLLYEVQAVLPDAELAHIAELVGLHTLLRTDVATTQVVRADFNRGAAGVAHLYAQLYRVSGLSAYHAASAYWLARAQAMLWARTTSALSAPYSPEPLGGLVGVGLVLLAATHKTCLDWDAVFV